MHPLNFFLHITHIYVPENFYIGVIALLVVGSAEDQFTLVRQNQILKSVQKCEHCNVEMHALDVVPLGINKGGNA